ncbi:RNA 2',3'-cyclic phosphodiesterase [Bacteriovorax sp. PP10]|uniref:RNA 2',3'-cyclic phosphodiesterase n=1 Tax=Bacteriovorax antarcticus TaxID=3088717 RepID=A0ABU5VWC1_9BACT|nr:RNA 2',3'-cyclic phosphodiesterase [Bacteriovorax sp. PP10]MEA9357352.1 RNA 2',3'-cyclic phosphodiesterase [Bacteriovorax sp. PP10]
MRLFLGVDAQNLILKKDQLNKLRVGLKSKDIEHRFEPHDQWHITLISLGDINQEDYEDREGYINNVIQAHPRFELKLQSVLAFPNLKEGRVLWIGVQNSRELRSLQADLCQQIPSFCELEFKPILPIVRLRNHKNVTNILSPYRSTQFGKLSVETVVLYEMISSGAFPVFRPLKTYYLSPLAA